MLLRSTVMSLLVFVAAPTLAHAQEASPAQAIAHIRELLLYANYDDATGALETYLERHDLDAAGRNAGLEVRVTIQIARREERRARQTLATLFARDPGHRLSESDPSPPVLSAFGRARENPPPPVQVVLHHDAPSLSTRTPPTLDVAIGGDGASAVQELRLRYRQADERDYSTIVMNVQQDISNARLPLLDDPNAYEVEYFIEAMAPSRTVLSSVGSRDAPLAFTVPEAPIGTSPALGLSGTANDPAVVDDEGGSLAWLWITLGVALVAGGVAVAVVLATNGGPDDGSLGNVTLPLVSF